MQKKKRKPNQRSTSLGTPLLLSAAMPYYGYGAGYPYSYASYGAYPYSYGASAYSYGAYPYSYASYGYPYSYGSAYGYGRYY